ncbi:MAG: DUF1570 domain-containing protein [Planctomycetes bacterium]|nr:DUF1570 domain-containing protein [Planctomycetota bacterium]
MWSRRLVLTLLATTTVAGCVHWRKPAPLPTGSTLRIGQLVINSDFPLPPEHRLLSDLTQLRVRISDELALPSGGEPVEVFLFQTPRGYQTFLRAHHPGVPQRRALFVESDTHLRVYAAWGDRVAEDLRHEVSHGYLHSLVTDLPLWIDEGLAESFEVGADERGLNRPHVDRLLAASQQGAWQPDVTRLAMTRSIDDMQQTQYAESWAWIHWLLNSTPQNRSLLQGYLAALRQRQNPVPLHEMMLKQNPAAANDLMAHLQRLR